MLKKKKNSDLEKLRVFQSNLLSLISHELRTPLTGILNALSLLDSEERVSEFSAMELVSMARRNAYRLQQTLSEILDFAAIESENFNVRLNELRLDRLVRRRLDSLKSIFNEQGVKIEIQERPQIGPVLGDAQKLGRVLDLCFQWLMPIIDLSSPIKLRISSTSFNLTSILSKKHSKLFSIKNKKQYFPSILQKEKTFLGKLQEGLQSEQFLIEKIMELHKGRFVQTCSGRRLVFSFYFPNFSSEEGLRTVLASRVYRASTGLESFACVLIQVPKNVPVKIFKTQISDCLFRTSDAIYSLAPKRQIALVMDDCKAKDLPKLLKRIENTLGHSFMFGSVCCPTDGTDPDLLFELLKKRTKINAPHSTPVVSIISRV